MKSYADMKLSRKMGMDWLLLAAFLLGLSACVADELELCLSEQRAGHFHLDHDACGCTKLVCKPTEQCIDGQCCDPHLNNCGPCLQTCASSEICARGQCCDPTQASESSNCGCAATCDADKQRCGKAPDSDVYRCLCSFDPFNDKSFQETNCGCTDPPTRCEPGWQCGVIQQEVMGAKQFVGACTCKSSDNLRNPLNCGCNGPCPGGSNCIDGVCTCLSSQQVVCTVPDPADANKAILKCVSKAECQCNPQNPPLRAYRDPLNCGCKGPCSPGQKCMSCQKGSGASCSASDDRCDPTTQACEARCMCDPFQHVSDDYDCFCRRSTNASAQTCTQENPGYACLYGTCQCDPLANLTNAQNCGCNGPCIRQIKENLGELGTRTCSGGVCLCDVAANSYNDKFCACDVTCAAPTPKCHAGKCVQCISDADCGGAKPLCNTERKVCVACKVSRDCPGYPTVYCLGDQTCSRCTIAYPRQDPICPIDSPWCQGAGTAAAECVQCLLDAHCSAPKAHCVGNECRECARDADCPTGKRCTPHTYECR